MTLRHGWTSNILMITLKYAIAEGEGLGDLVICDEGSVHWSRVARPQREGVWDMTIDRLVTQEFN